MRMNNRIPLRKSESTAKTDKTDYFGKSESTAKIDKTDYFGKMRLDVKNWGKAMFSAKRIISIVMIVLMVLPLLTSCTSKKNVSSNEFGVYCLNSSETALVKEKYKLSSTEVSDQIEELLKVMSTEKEEENRVCAIPEGVVVSEFEVSMGELELHFNREYQNIENIREVLLRSAVAKTMLQLDDISSVSFYISNEPVKDASGNVIGQMTNDSFLDTFGEKEEALESNAFALYYASKDGQGLIRKSRILHYNNTMSSENVVLTYLAKNPETDDGAMPVISSSVKILSVTTKEGTCHVKLDSSFLSQSENISTNVAVYGIVNSLTELDNVNKVEIIIDSDSTGVVPKNDTVSGTYEADMTLVK